MRLGLILGDQLSQQLATLKALDREQDVILMAEVVDEATYVQHHVQKLHCCLVPCATLPRHLSKMAGKSSITSTKPKAPFGHYSIM